MIIFSFANMKIMLKFYDLIKIIMVNRLSYIQISISYQRHIFSGNNKTFFLTSMFIAIFLSPYLNPYFLLCILVYNPQGSKGIRQYSKNCFTSSIMIHKNYPFCRLQLVVEKNGLST